MTNREDVIALVMKLPEDAPLHEIARAVELLAGIQTAREEGTPAADTDSNAFDRHSTSR